jgi:leucyl aminopeptidase
MKKIQILFTKAASLSNSKLPKEVISLLQKEINLKYIDTKKGFLKSYINGTKQYIIAHTMGNKSDDRLQAFGAKAAKLAISQSNKGEKAEVQLVFDKSIKEQEKLFLSKGLLMARQNDNAFKSEQKQGSVDFKGVEDKKLIAITDAIDIARDLTSRPSNILSPDAIEEYAKKLTKKNKSLKLKILTEKDLKKQKMNMHLAVNAGSPQEARMFIFEHNPKKSKEAPLALIGKGLMYDSGGYYAKPYPHMGDMHGDMAGAASVIGIMSALSELGITKRVIGVCSIAENMIDAKAYRNGDILTSRKGKTVEVGHTDAEGRLVLADSLNYIEETYKPELMFDFATLTGATISAVGEMYTSIFSDNKKLIENFSKIGNEVNDKVWSLPFDDDVKEAVKGKIADLCNTSNLSGMLGASTAAAFLSNFVSDTKKWVHFDIAGTAHRTKMKKDYDLKNLLGTGASVHLILEYLSRD